MKCEICKKKHDIDDRCIDCNRSLCIECGISCDCCNEIYCDVCTKEHYSGSCRTCPNEVCKHSESHLCVDCYYEK